VRSLMPDSMLRRNRRIPTPPRWAQRGATFIEAVVALGMLVIAMGMATSLSFRAIQDGGLVGRRASAALIAQERMEDLLAHAGELNSWAREVEKGFEVDATEQPGTYRFADADLGDFRWTWEVRAADNEPDLAEARVSVYWRPAGNVAKWPCVRLHTLTRAKGNKKAFARHPAPVEEVAP